MVTLNHEFEEGQDVCPPFWPTQENEATQYGTISVTLLSSTNYEEFEVRKFQLRDDRVMLVDSPANGSATTATTPCV